MRGDEIDISPRTYIKWLDQRWFIIEATEKDFNNLFNGVWDEKRLESYKEKLERLDKESGGAVVIPLCP